MYTCLFLNLSLCLSPALLLDRARARYHTLTLPLSHSLFVLLSRMQPPPALSVKEKERQHHDESKHSVTLHPRSLARVLDPHHYLSI